LFIGVLKESSKLFDLTLRCIMIIGRRLLDLLKGLPSLRKSWTLVVNRLEVPYNPVLLSKFA